MAATALFAAIPAYAAAPPPSIQLAAYDVDGTNSGTARLTNHVNLAASVQGTADQSVTWSLQGAGSLSGTQYQAPATMPANPTVTINASLTDSPSVSTSYTFTLVNPVPVIYHISGNLNTAATNPIGISAGGVVPGTVVLVNGSAVASSYQSSSAITAQIPIAANASGSVQITLQNPTPAGGVSAPLTATIATPVIQVAAYSSDGTNTGTGRLTEHINLGVSLKGTGQQAVTWSLQGAGSLSGTQYQAPATMPANPTVTLTAVLTASPSISASYTFTLVNPVPVIYRISGVLNTAATNAITISGGGIVPGSVVLVNGTAVPSAYANSGSIAAQVPVAANASGSLPIAIQNPAPVGGVSAPVATPIAAPSIQVFAYNEGGTNAGTAGLTEHMNLGVSIKGTGQQAFTWSLQGAGSISGTQYQAPATMPASPTVTITAALTASPSVSSSYTFTLVNPVPVIYTVSGTLNTAASNAITISGGGIVPGTVVLVNGTAAPSTYLTSGSITAQVSVPANAIGTLPITLQNPSPVGGLSNAVVAPIAKSTIQVLAYNGDGTNSGTARLTNHLDLGVSIKGTAEQAVTWSLQGAGSLSGMQYQAPATMPPSPTVTITAALAASPSVSASYTFTLVNPVPVIYNISGTLNKAATNAITISGGGIVPGTVVLVNGAAVPASYANSGSITAQIPVPANATGSLQISMQNPAPVGGVSAPFTASLLASTIQIFAYNGAGTNAGTAGLTQHIDLGVAIKGTAEQAVTWSLQGAGSISGMQYQAPNAMPGNPTVTISAALTASPSVSASYTFTLVNPVPVIYHISGTLNRAATNAIAISGGGIVPATLVLVNGAPVPATYGNSGSITAQITVPANAAGTLPITLQNPSPVGGVSVALVAPVATTTIQLFGYNAAGTNAGVAGITEHVDLGVAIKGTGAQAVTWTLQGAGSLSGMQYQAPATMPANPTVTISVALTASPSVSASYTFTLVNPLPVIYHTNGNLQIAMTNAMTVVGAGIVPGTTVLVNGAAVPSSYTGSSAITAQISVPANASGPLSITLQNPAPAGGVSAAFLAPVTLPNVHITAFTPQGTNTGTAAIGAPLQLSTTVTGAGSSLVSSAVNWALQGPGTLSSNGVYVGPAYMPAGASVTVTASLAANAAATGSYSFSLTNPVPSINATLPVQLSIGAATSLTVSGYGFVPGTTVLVNGQSVSASYQSPSSLIVLIPTQPAGVQSVSLVASSQAPGGGQSTPFTLRVAGDMTVAAQISTVPGHAIADDFVGFSAEWGDAQTWIGSAAQGKDNIYRQLLHNVQLGTTYPLLIRIGGCSTDKTGEPPANYVQPFAELHEDLGTRFTLGVNLGADNPQLAADQALFYSGAMPSGSIAAIELGNEPDGYTILGGCGIDPSTSYRPSTYTYQSYFSDFTTWANALQPVLPSGIKLMGPAWDAVRSPLVETQFEQQEGSYVSLISQHYYTAAQQPGSYFPPEYLLDPAMSTTVASGVASFVQLAHQNNQLFRMGEMNSINVGGVAGVSNAFGSALWAIDTMFELANVEADGVNWNGLSGCNYCQFDLWYKFNGSQYIYSLKNVKPIYYGLLFFRQATQNQGQLLPVTYSTSSNIKIWSTLGADGKVRVAIINKDPNFAGHVQLSLSGHGDAEVIQLSAPSYTSTNGVTLAGQTFDGSIDGTILGTPLSATVQQQNGTYNIPVQPTSAVLVTIN